MSLSEIRPLIMIQARTGSSRLPGKVLAELCGEPILSWVIGRCSRSRLRGDMAVVTSDLTRDDPVAKLAAGSGTLVYRGSESDVLRRYVEAAHEFRARVVVRITADCPFIDPDVIDQVIELYRRRQADYVCVKDYPEGLGSAELVSLSALEAALSRTRPSDTYFREHVCTYLTANPDQFDLFMPAASYDLQRPHLKFSVDTDADLNRSRRIAQFFCPRKDFHIRDVLAWQDTIAHDRVENQGDPI